MKKILMICRFSQMGGTRTFYNNLIEYMLERNFKIYLLFVNNVLSNEQVELLKKNKISYKVLKAPIFSKRSYQNIYVNFYCAYFVLKHGVNKIIFTQWGLNRDYLSLPVLFFRRRVVLFVHSEAYSPKRFRIVAKGLKYVFSKLIQNNKLITVSEHNKQRIVKNWSVNNDDVKVLYNYSRINLRKNDNESAIQKKILTLGHVRDYKNPEMWLKVAKVVTKMNKNVKFIWAGEGERLEEFKNKTQFESNIHFLGHIKDVDKLYCDADIYLQLSRMETQGIAVLDAMRYRIPCIVSNRGGLPESVENNFTGYVVDIENVDTIVKKINFLLNNETKRITMGNRGYDLYTSKFTKDKWYVNLDKYL